jgi:hypothetical protein
MLDRPDIWTDRSKARILDRAGGRPAAPRPRTPPRRGPRRAASGRRPSSFGPARRVRPRSRRAVSIFSAGRNSTRTSVLVPAFAKSCFWPGGTTTTSPGPATTRWRPIRKRIVPSTTSKRSSCFGWMCWPPGTWPPAGSPEVDRQQLSVSAALRRIVIRSPLAGFSSVCPANGTSAPLGVLDFNSSSIRRRNRTVYD